MEKSNTFIVAKRAHQFSPSNERKSRLKGPTSAENLMNFRDREESFVSPPNVQLVPFASGRTTEMAFADN